MLATTTRLPNSLTVILFEPSWNPAVDVQGVDRAYRVGQKREVRLKAGSSIFTSPLTPVDLDLGRLLPFAHGWKRGGAHVPPPGEMRERFFGRGWQFQHPPITDFQNWAR